MIKIGMMLGDRYEILEKIGTGGMSDVYKAKCHKLNRFVAVKVLKQEFSENVNFVSKFKTEAQAAAGMMHPNIVNVYDVGEENGTYYIVMELVEGITLKKYIEKKARLSVKEAVSIAIQVSMGIEAAHNNHIIHRDIKPQNIMISRDGKVKVTDFGIAKAVTSNTITSNVMGSVHYTSPEQARGGYSDEKSDIYSLGITMFEMLTGRVPFNGDTTVAIAIKHIQEPMPSPREYIPEIPISVEQIVFKCTQKSPDRRYQSMGELIEDLKKSLMRPDEDFVKIANPDEEASTRMITEKDMQQIKKQSRNRDSMEEEIRLRSDHNNSSGKKKRPKTIDEPRHTSSKKQEHDDDDDSKMEKITTILAIIAAIIIGVIVIFLVGRAMGLFNLSTGEKPQSTTTDVTENTSVAEDEKNGIKVPDVTNLSYAEAVAALKKEGFEIEKVETESDTVAKGNIIEQIPAAGEYAPLGSTVVLSVSISANAGKIRVPNVVGLSEEEATITLVEAGLTPGTVSQTTNDDPSLIDKVCYQSYSVGVYVEKGTVVDLKVSVGAGESTYSFVGNIESPAAEDDQYQAGSSATVILTTSNGLELKRETTTTFPLAFNISGITGAEDGVITIVYNVTIPGSTTTNENGEIVTTPERNEERSVKRTVKFAKE
ncbi:MAG: Stk1 family PASTA domain-containing Ser/Thr kinase [Lachnospiraceae bacterium]|nr:Stk1 family PASTA domain-containing Ser/Thr kinase [Lachnospiraceae bacterium]